MTSRELDPAAVARRLEQLRARYEPEDEAAARRRMTPPRRVESLAEGAARRLAELRELMELTAALHRRDDEG